MEKRRTFKRTKAPENEKSAASKKPDDKKSAAKKILAAVKRTRPEEPQKPVAEKPKTNVVSEAAAIVAAVEKAEKAEADQAAKNSDKKSSENISDSDVVVIEETTVTTTDIRTDEPSMNKRSLGFVFVLLGIFVIFLAGGLAFAFLFQQPAKPEHVYTAPTDTPAPTIAQAPEPSNWKVEVLNGSGISGAAAKLAQKLQTLGYTVAKVGNADTNQTKTTFTLSKDFLPYASTFKENLAKEEITASDGGELSNSTYSAQIILGSE